MNTQFKDLRVGSEVYFVEENTCSYTNATITNVSICQSPVHGLAYANDKYPFAISVNTAFSDHATIARENGNNIHVFVNESDALNYFNELVSAQRKAMAAEMAEEKINLKADEDECQDCTFKDITAGEMRDALSRMDPIDALLWMSNVARALGLFKKENVKPSTCPKPVAPETKPSYPVPPSDTIVDKMNIDSHKLNKLGGLDSVPATLLISINENGMETLNSSVFDGINPIFRGPKLYFHSIKVPALPADATDTDVDAVYKAIEDWMYAKYPELEHLHYGEDFEYAILKGSDLSVESDDVIDFNIFA